MLRLRRCPVCRRVMAAAAICLSCLAAAPMLSDAPEREPAMTRTTPLQVSSGTASTLSVGWVPHRDGGQQIAVHAHWTKEAAIGAGFYDVYGSRPLPAATAIST